MLLAGLFRSLAEHTALSFVVSVGSSSMSGCALVVCQSGSCQECLVSRTHRVVIVVASLSPRSIALTLVRDTLLSAVDA